MERPISSSRDAWPERGEDSGRDSPEPEARAVLYTTPSPADVAQAQVLQQNLKAIGLAVEIMQFPRPLIFEKLAGGGNGFDIGRFAWGHSPDPSWFADTFDGRTIGQAGNQNWS